MSCPSTSGPLRAVMVALPGEAGRLRRKSAASTRLYVCGIGALRARAGAEQAIRDGCQMLVSWGCAAGLDPKMRSGDLLLVHRVWTSDPQPLVVEPLVLNEMARALPRDMTWQRGDLAETSKLLHTPADKHRLWCRTGAHLADMETAAIATAAERAGVPWAAIRVVVDEAGDAIGHAISQSINSRGHVAISRMAWELARAPGQIPDLMRLASAFRRTRAVLDRAASALAW